MPPFYGSLPICIGTYPLTICTLEVFGAVVHVVWLDGDLSASYHRRLGQLRIVSDMNPIFLTNRYATNFLQIFSSPLYLPPEPRKRVAYSF